jgi:uncharacterized membrane protein HdeD (DUF308 family)
MEFLGVNIALVTALSVIVIGLVEWFKTPSIPTWAVRLISLAISFAVVGLVILVNPMTWQIFIVTGFAVFFVTNGIYHTADVVRTTKNQ